MVIAQWAPKSLWNIPCFHAFYASRAQCFSSTWQSRELTALKAALVLQLRRINTFPHQSTSKL